MSFKLTRTICNDWLIEHGYTNFRVSKEMLEDVETNVLYLTSDTDKKHPLCDLGWVDYIEKLEHFFRLG
ncbi:hypothetical protein C7H19_24145 [Aphanothece hegewaldii CCALA 016]|uniref:Uncharacterized protein n=1 Tax=Aphanothece hegewaldii CCALA 016 TaxID=2107694 RepID=A0A2T1LQX0_9CHRO|nr:hypothetical protein [Aphanothece hegewaldii]PSF30021.1 hypothetical protein C7H19_24145 [Aphanothece hegewaldii CCALA 016]